MYFYEKYFSYAKNHFKKSFVKNQNKISFKFKIINLVIFKKENDDDIIN